MKLQEWLGMCQEYTASENYRGHLAGVVDLAVAEADRVHGRDWSTLVTGIRSVYAPATEVAGYVRTGRLGDMERMFRDRSAGHKARDNQMMGVLGFGATRLAVGEVTKYHVLTPSAADSTARQQACEAWFDDLREVGLPPWDMLLGVVDRRRGDDGQLRLNFNAAALWGRQVYYGGNADLSGWFAQTCDTGRLLPDLEDSARTGVLMAGGRPWATSA